VVGNKTVVVDAMAVSHYDSTRTNTVRRQQRRYHRTPQSDEVRSWSENIDLIIVYLMFHQVWGGGAAAPCAAPPSC